MKDSIRPQLSVEEVPSFIPPVQTPTEPLTQIPQPSAEPSSEPVNPVTTTSSKPVDSPHKKSFAKTLLLFLIPVILLVGTLAVVSYLTQTEFVVRPPEVTPTPDSNVSIMSPSTEPSPTPDAKTFTYTTANFAVSYPRQIPTKECDQGIYFIQVGGPLGERPGPDSFDCDTIELTDVDAAIFFVSQEFGEVLSEEEVTIKGRNATRIEYPQANIYQVEINNEVILIADNTSDNSFEGLFEILLENIEFYEDITLDWIEFDNETFKYRLRHDPEWNVQVQTKNKDELLPTTVIRKDTSESIASMVIESRMEVKNAGITASEISSSTTSLAGWKSPPDSRYIRVGEAEAQRVRGEFNGVWKEYVVVWYRDRIYEIEWQDSIDQENQIFFDQMLSSMEVY